MSERLKIRNGAWVFTYALSKRNLPFVLNPFYWNGEVWVYGRGRVYYKIEDLREGIYCYDNSEGRNFLVEDTVDKERLKELMPYHGKVSSWFEGFRA